jgi:hypothetical protein
MGLIDRLFENRSFLQEQEAEIPERGTFRVPA